MLYNRGAQCCFNSGSVPKLGAGAVCSGRADMFQRNSDQNTAAWSQCSCSSAIGSTSRPYTRRSGPEVVWARRLLYELIFIQVFLITAGSLWSSPGPFIARGVLLRAVSLSPTHTAQPHRPLLLASICMFCMSVWSRIKRKMGTQTTKNLPHAINCVTAEFGRRFRLCTWCESPVQVGGCLRCFFLPNSGDSVNKHCYLHSLLHYSRPEEGNRGFWSGSLWFIDAFIGIRAGSTLWMFNLQETVDLWRFVMDKI